MSKETKKKILKIITIIISISILVIVVLAFLPTMKTLATNEGRLSFKDKIGSMGIQGFLLLFLLESIQILLVVLPGEPIEILYGMCYGSILGAVYLTIAVFINTIIVYYVVHKYGRRVFVFFFSEEKMEKIEKSKLLNNPAKIEYLMMFLFFLPGTPKDLLLYIGALLPIDKKKFILISTFVRFPSVITSTIAGDGITSNNITLTVAIYAIMAVVLCLVILILSKTKNKKHREIKEAMNELK